MASSVGRHTYGVDLLTIRKWNEKDGLLHIGSFCSLAGDIRIQLGGNHRHEWVTTYPFGAFGWYEDKEINHAYTKGNVVIGNDVWIGEQVTILSGVTIGDGACIGARAVVSKNVPPYAIVVGNSGRIARYRFTPEQIEALMKIKWWEWDDTKIKENVELMCSKEIDGFISKHLSN